MRRNKRGTKARQLSGDQRRLRDQGGPSAERPNENRCSRCGALTNSPMIEHADDCPFRRTL